MYFENLEQQTDYVIYLILIDRGFNLMEAIGNMEFRTKDRYSAAQFQMRFLKTYINSIEKGIISDYIAFILS